jgi:hypothetical protein
MRVQLTAAGRVGASASPRGDAGSRDGHAGGGGGRSPAASRRRDSANERRHRLRRRHSHVCVPFDLSPCDWARAAGWWVCHLDRSLGRGRLPPGVGATASTSGPRAHQASWCHDRPAPRPGQHHPDGMMCSGRGGVGGPGCAWLRSRDQQGGVRRVTATMQVEGRDEPTGVKLWTRGPSQSGTYAAGGGATRGTLAAGTPPDPGPRRAAGRLGGG